MKKTYINASLAELANQDLSDKSLQLTNIVDSTNVDKFLEYANKIQEHGGQIDFVAQYDEAVFARLATLPHKNLVCMRLTEDYTQRKWNAEIMPDFRLIRVPASKTMWLENANNKKNIVTATATPAHISDEYKNEISDVIKKEFGNFENMTDLEKVVAVDCFLQRNVQYVYYGPTKIGDYVYKTPKQHGICEKPIDAINNKFGICEDYAALMALLLNNPTANIQCYEISRFNHAWNDIVIGGKTYVHDTTRNVTRGKNRFENALQATDYNHDATLSTAKDLFDNKLAKEPLQHEQEPVEMLHTCGYNKKSTQIHPYSNKPIDRAQIQNAIASLKQKGFNFEFAKQPHHNQYRERINEDIINR